MESSKNPNIKEFIKYLDKTLDMFDKYIPDEDFERKDSDAYKLFTTLFRMYDDIAQNDEPIKKNNNNISRIVAKHIKNKKRLKNNRPKWENHSVDSDIIAQKMYRNGMRNMYDTDDGPILFTEDVKKKQNPSKTLSVKAPNTSFFTDQSSDSESDNDNSRYEKTDDIETKLRKLKERLSKI